MSEQFRWDSIVDSKEPRVFMLLNRFTLDSTVLFVTASSKLVLGVDSVDIVGRSVYEFIVDEDIERLQRELVHLKETEQIMRTSFGWLGRKRNSNNDDNDEAFGVVSCEAVISSTCDGLVCIIHHSAPELKAS